MPEPGEELEEGAEHHAHTPAEDPHTHYEGRIVDLVGVIQPGDNIRVWADGDTGSYENVPTQSYGGTIEFPTAQDIGPNELGEDGTHASHHRTVEHMERITIDTWLMHKGEMPWFMNSELFRAVMTDGHICLIEKLPKDEHISELRDKQHEEERKKRYDTMREAQSEERTAYHAAWKAKQGKTTA